MSPSNSARGTKRGHGIHHQHVDGTGAHQGVGDLKRLLAGIGLGDQQLLDVDPKLVGIDRVERMLGIDEGAGAAALLGFRHHMERQGGLARAFRPVNLDHPAAGQAADPERDIEAQGARRDRFGLHHRAFAQLHDRALAEGPLDLTQRGVQRLLLIHVFSLDNP